MAMLLPAVQSAREAARRRQCSNSLRQIAIALHNHEDSNGTLPPGTIMNGQGDPDVPAMGTGWGWGAFILPYLEETGAYELIEFGSTVADPMKNRDAAELVATYICPTSQNDNGFWIKCCSHFNHGGSPTFDFRESNDAGVSDYFNGFFAFSQSVSDGSGVLFNYHAVKLNRVVDGTSNSLMVGEVTGGPGRHPSEGDAWIGHTWVSWNCQDAFDGINNFNSMPGGRSVSLDPFYGDGDCRNRHCEYYDETGFSSFHPVSTGRLPQPTPPISCRTGAKSVWLATRKSVTGTPGKTATSTTTASSTWPTC